MGKEVHQLKSAEFIPLSEIRSLIGQPLKVDIPQGKITKEGIEAILEYLKTSYPGVELPCPNGTTFFQWIWLDPKEGTLPKRMAKWLKKRTKTNPEQKIIAHVGNLARQNSDDSQAYYFRIVDKFDWAGNEFGKTDGGCWWGARGANQCYGKPQPKSYAEIFEKNGGLGVQFFRTDNYSYSNGIGRLWLYIEPDNRFAATFNGYWDNEGATLRLTRVLASFLGLSYKQCPYLTSSFGIYVNDDKGYFIGNEQALNFLQKSASYKIPKKIVYKPCSHCKESFDENVLIEAMCTPCYNATRKLCPLCQDRRDSTTFKQVRTNDGLIDWCSNCVANYAGGCRGCHNAYISQWFNYPGCVKVDGVYMCTKCTMSSRKCQDCGERTVNTDAMDEALCLRCEKLFEEEISIPYEMPEVRSHMTIAAEHANRALRRLRHQLANNATLTTEVVEEDADCPF